MPSECWWNQIARVTIMILGTCFGLKGGGFMSNVLSLFQRVVPEENLDEQTSNFVEKNWYFAHYLFLSKF
ncbi:uncharacterized protein BT62DRAFT_935470 [Guyanagaster necrorhizus]|uniref:Uncharacterized protein n=1 Tax=Guyanagaster necrorhizus TaxID=856835 RepID=A0A9P8APM7_9AGAR|nr:uncharacterized protein BT62DRAFT_935470 [Guyanagaster necrorhizus MCA 3950]KAG7443134.1 hypothetical protein BT62DRAFT_935470 [Guyanagaster necrorhizus MCA 3950]